MYSLARPYSSSIDSRNIAFSFRRFDQDRARRISLDRINGLLREAKPLKIVAAPITSERERFALSN